MQLQRKKDEEQKKKSKALERKNKLDRKKFEMQSKQDQRHYLQKINKFLPVPKYPQ